MPEVVLSPGASSADGEITKYYNPPGGTRSLEVSRDAEANGNTPTYGRVFNSSALLCGVRKYAGVGFYQIVRAGILFDCSGIAAGTQILSAELKLTAGAASNSTNPLNYNSTYYIVGNGSGGAIANTNAAMNPSHGSPVAGDWTSAGSIDTYGSQAMGSSVSVGDSFTTSLSAAALTAIASSAGSTFDILICSHWDYKDDYTLSPSITTAFTTNGFQFAAFDHSTVAYRPTLTITTPDPVRGIILTGGNMIIKSGKVILK